MGAAIESYAEVARLVRRGRKTRCRNMESWSQRSGECAGPGERVDVREGVTLG